MKIFSGSIFLLILLVCETSAFSQKDDQSAIICGKIIVNQDSIAPYRPYSIILQKDWPITFKQFEQQEIDTTGFSFRINMNLKELTYGELIVNFFRNIDSTTFLHNKYWIPAEVPRDFRKNKYYLRIFQDIRFVIEPGDSLYVVVDYNKLDQYHRPVVRFTGSAGANNNLLRIRDRFHYYNRSFKMPIEKGLSNEQQKMESKLENLNGAKDSISYAFFNLLKKDILFDNLKQKHALIRASLYGPEIEHSEKRSVARERYAYLDTLRLRTEYLESHQFRGFLDYYLEYINRIITGDDVPFLNFERNYWLAKGVFKKGILKYFLYENLLYKMEKPGFYNREVYQYEDFLRNFPNTPESNRLTRVYKKHYPVSIGQYAPELVLTDSTGKKFRLSQLKGKVVMISTGPYLYKLEKSKEWFKSLGRDFDDEFVLILLGTPFKRYVSSFPPYFVYAAGREDNPKNYFNYYFQEATDYNFILNKKGEIVSTAISFDRIDEKISELIEEKYTPLTRIKDVLKRFIFEIAIVLLVLVTATLLLLVISRLRHKRQELIKQRLNSELKAIRSQLNPHFLFNSLNSIQNYINKNDSKSANIQLAKFSTLMRTVIELSEKESTSLKDELNFNKTFIELEQLRYGFKCNFDIDNSIDLFNTEIPTMIIQPFIENAIVHCMAESGTKGELNISVKEKTEDNIYIEIKDNGKGFPVNSEKGFGLKSSRERIDLLNSKNREKIELIIESPADNQTKTGSAIKLIIPKKY